MELNSTPQRGSRAKFIVGGLLILAAVIYLIASSTYASAQYFVTVDELMVNQEANMQRKLRVSGAVIGETISFDPQTLHLEFTVAHVPGDNKDIEAEGGLAAALYHAVNDPGRTRMVVVVENQPKPDLLRNEAQAIMTGTLGEDGIFYADELLLKCPTKYEEAVPNQAEGN
jgi:cytochrome c-type biogenesis protein CcmE